MRKLGEGIGNRRPWPVIGEVAIAEAAAGSKEAGPGNEVASIHRSRRPCAVVRTSLTLDLLSALLLADPARAQEEPAEPAEPAQESRRTYVMSPAQVAAEAQAVITQLYRLQARIHHVSQIEHHVARIGALGNEVKRLKIDSDLDTLDIQPQRELRNLREHWL